MAFHAKFTENSAKAVSNAQQEARMLGHNYVGTEHLLLGLVVTNHCAASDALRRFGVTKENVIEEITALVGRNDDQSNNVPSDFTPRTKNIIENSARIMRQLGHSYIGTEHLLLSLMQETTSVAVRILTDLGVDLKKLQNELLSSLQSHSQGGEDASAGSASEGGETPRLDQFTRDLTKAAKDGELDPVIGRNAEIERVVQILSRRTKNNPVLIGEPGVGKTAVVEGLAQRIADGTIPELLRDRRVLALDLSGMLAGAKFRGEFEERLKDAMEEIEKAGNIILFIDELHTLVGAGAAEGAIDAANILKPALARGKIQAVGATTISEYRKYIEKDAALERRFQPVTVGEPSQEDAVAILRGLRDKYEAHHKVKISDEALTAAVELSARYISDRFLPDKAIDLMDEAASRLRLQNYIAPPDMKELEAKLESLALDKQEAVNNQNYEKAAQIRDQEKAVQAEIERQKSSWEVHRDQKELVVTAESIAEIVSSWVGVPVAQLTEEESVRLLRLEETLHQRVIGQDEAVSAVARAIRRSRAGLKDPKRPIGSFLFLGPTGVGKTELSRALAEAMFATEDAMIRIDMSEYMEKHTVSRLVGAPPGYVGYEEGGQLTDKVRSHPYSVILLDEIEKAHPDVFNVLLQILEDGRLTDGKGRTVDFRNTIIIMTSNAGAMQFGLQKHVGFGAHGEQDVHEYEQMKETALEALKSTFRPEFLNRIDEIIVFHRLDEKDTRRIADLMLRTVAKRMKEQGVDLEISDAAGAFLAKAGFDENYGARPLRRAIQRMVEDGLSEELLSGKVRIGDTVLCDVQDDHLVFVSRASERTEPDTEITEQTEAV